MTLRVEAYPGLASFQDDPVWRRRFRGRVTESEQLLQLVLAESISVLYSRSGFGKTSLINASLMEALRRRGFFPAVARVTELPGGPVASIIHAIKRAAEREGVQLERASPETTLWEFLHDQRFTKNGRPIRLVLILDQFEELFTRLRERDREDGTEVEEQLIQELADVVRHRLPEAVREAATAELEEADPERRTELVQLLYDETGPDVKVLLSMREDYLPDLERLRSALPTIFQKMMRLEPLSIENARKAIVEPAEGLFTYTPQAVDLMLAFLRKRQVGNRMIESGGVDPGQLQIICQHLDRNRGERTTIKKADLGKDPDAGMRRILKSFYRNVLRKFPELWLGWNTRRWRPSLQNLVLAHSPRAAIRHLVEDGLITRSGFRNSLARDTIVQLYGVPEKDLRLLLHEKLVRSVSRLDSEFFELTHDTLIQPIREARRSWARRIVGLAILVFVLFISAMLGLGLILEGQAKREARRASEQLEQQEKARKATVLQQLKTTKDFSTRNLSSMRFQRPSWQSLILNAADLQKSVLDGGTLANVQLSGARLEEASLRDVHFVQCDLSGAHAARADFAGASFLGCDLRHFIGGRARFQDVDMTGCDLRGATMFFTMFRNVAMADVDMAGVSWFGTDFEETAWWLARGWSDRDLEYLRRSFPPERLRSTDGYRQRLFRLNASVEESGSPNALFRRAEYRAVRGAELDLALQDATTVLARLPESSEVRALRGYILLQLSRPRDAVSELTKSLRLESNGLAEWPAPDEAAAYQLALAHEQLGNAAEASRWFAKAEAGGYEPTYERVLTPRKRLE